MAKEAKARIKINKLLEDSGWQLLDSPQKKANVLFENNVKITKESFDELGEISRELLMDSLTFYYLMIKDFH